MSTLSVRLETSIFGWVASALFTDMIALSDLAAVSNAYPAHSLEKTSRMLKR